MPTIGVSISAAIAEVLDTGALGILDRLRGSTDPEKLFQTVPMIGPSLARAIHETLHVDTLEALEAATADGRLATVSIPLFISFTSAGLPLAVTFSFLISSSLIDLASVILLASIFDWSVALAYFANGLVLSVPEIGALLDSR